MKTHWHWVKGFAQGSFKDGKKFEAPIWAGSDQSEAEAQVELANAISERIKMWGERSSKKTAEHRSAEYGLSDLVETLLERGEKPELGQWAVTRNGYGCQTLCVEHLFIADIDGAHANYWNQLWHRATAFEKFKTWCAGFTETGRQQLAIKHAQKLAWEKKLAQAELLWPGAPKDRLDALARLYHITEEDPTLSLEVFRTTRGFRVFERSRPWNPRDESTQKLMSQMGCDHVYMMLCKKQDCFRARLDAKPWRCGSVRPDARYPFKSEEQKVAFEQWLEDFERKAALKRACAWVGRIGALPSWEVSDDLCAFHEQRSGARDQTKKLA